MHTAVCSKYVPINPAQSASACMRAESLPVAPAGRNGNRMSVAHACVRACAGACQRNGWQSACVCEERGEGERGKGWGWAGGEGGGGGGGGPFGVQLLAAMSSHAQAHVERVDPPRPSKLDDAAHAPPPVALQLLPPAVPTPHRSIDAARKGHSGAAHRRRRRRGLPRCAGGRLGRRQPGRAGSAHGRALGQAEQLRAVHARGEQLERPALCGAAAHVRRVQREQDALPFAQLRTLAARWGPRIH